MTNAETATALLMDTLEERIDYLMSLIMHRDKDIAKLQADNRSLVEQMNEMALKQKQEVIEKRSPHTHPTGGEECVVVFNDGSALVDSWDSFSYQWGTISIGDEHHIAYWFYLPKEESND